MNKRLATVFFLAFAVASAHATDDPWLPKVPVLTLPADFGTAPAAKNSNAPVLLTQPTDGRTLILDLINHAQSSINLTIYELEDNQIIEALTAAAGRGVNVRVIYNHNSFLHRPKDPNAEAVAKLNAAGVKTKPASSRFRITHQKTFTFDDSTAVIMTFNLAPNYFTGTRDFGVVTADPAEVAEIFQVFEADWNDTTLSPSNPNLVWSPDNSRAKLLTLINSASKTLEVYGQEAEDKECMQALIDAAQRGVVVRFITAVLDDTANGEDKNAKEREYLNAHHVQAEGLKSPYIHAKMILADDRRAFLGSENFSYTSLNENRELGILVDDPNILSSLKSTFDSDWPR